MVFTLALPKPDAATFLFAAILGLLCFLAVEMLGEKTGAYTMEETQDMADFNKKNLNRFDAVLFLSTTRLNPTPEQRNALLDFARSGKGIIGIHAASDNFYEWEDGAKMIGGLFCQHPWTAGCTVQVKRDCSRPNGWLAEISRLPSPGAETLVDQNCAHRQAMQAHSTGYGGDRMERENAQTQGDFQRKDVLGFNPTHCGEGGRTPEKAALSGRMASCPSQCSGEHRSL